MCGRELAEKRLLEHEILEHHRSTPALREVLNAKGPAEAKELLDNYIKGAPDHHTAAHLAVLYVLYVRLSNSDSEDRDVGDNKITLVESQTPLALYSFYSLQNFCSILQEKNVFLIYL